MAVGLFDLCRLAFVRIVATRAEDFSYHSCISGLNALVRLRDLAFSNKEPMPPMPLMLPLMLPMLNKSLIIRR